MSKKGKKRFWAILVAAALVASLMISSVVAEEGSFVGSDKLSVETEEDEEVVEEVLIEVDEEIVGDEISEETGEVVESEEEVPAGELTEEADAEATEPIEGGAGSGV